MRTWITLISVFLVLSAVVFTEQKIISDFEKEADRYVMQITEKIKNNSVEAKDISEIKELWDKRENTIYMLSNHNYFSELEKSIAFMDFYFDAKNMSGLHSQLIIFDKCVEMLKDSSKLSISNIL